ncbi:MAG TPA: DUF2752 domain-containing protein [Blastocatellia bacterium]|nr:DUF2752 domain-containing protein [Blastocatellia bacterium]
MQASDSITEQDNLSTNDAEPSRSLAWLVLLGLTAVFIISVIHHPSEGNYFTICGFKNATGLPCPGCGLTHSFCALGKGHLLAAFGWNLLGPPLFLLSVLAWVRAICVLLDRQRFPRAFDSFAERYRLVRYSAYTFAAFGIARIIYILIADPGSIRQTPLSELWARLFS